ncbi:MAG: OB-fold domain-containing protein [Betaproteobacteria bacterium]|nr:OB-fold domain-containing protein [Betaproteobacteria bacterium]
MENVKDLSPLAAYVEYCKRGSLAYQFCPDDGTAVFYPRVINPVSGSPNLEWRVSKGLGTVYASTFVHKRGEEPYNVSIIEVDEGYRMMSRVEETAPDKVKIGMRVRVRMNREDENRPYPVFVPMETSDEQS